MRGPSHPIPGSPSGLTPACRPVGEDGWSPSPRGQSAPTCHLFYCFSLAAGHLLIYALLRAIRRLEKCSYEHHASAEVRGAASCTSLALFFPSFFLSFGRESGRSCKEVWLTQKSHPLSYIPAEEEGASLMQKATQTSILCTWPGALWGGGGEVSSRLCAQLRGVLSPLYTHLSGRHSHSHSPPSRAAVCLATGWRQL